MSADKKKANGSEHGPHARLCHIVKWDHFDGYGFDLHAEKGKPGQYIGKVDGGSPAQAAGLRQGDRIIEVNGASIADKTHKEVVELIKAGKGETKLLVVDPNDEDGHTTANNANNTTSSPKMASTKSAIIGDGAKNGGTDSNKNALSNGHDHTDKNDHQEVNEKSNNKTVTMSTTTTTTETQNGALNLNMTAAELRARLAAKKKFDPKKETMDFKKKFDIIQKM